MPDSVANPALSSETPAVLAMAPAPDLALFTGALVKGEEAAWAEFHDRYRLRLLGYLARIWHGESASLDDLLQDTFLRAVRHMRVFREEDSLWSWLTVLARSAVMDHGRRRSRWWRFLQRWRREAKLWTLPGTSDESGPSLDTALAELDPEARALLDAKYYRRLPVRTIAADLKISEKAVEGRLSRARQKLAKLLERSSHEPRA